MRKYKVLCNYGTQIRVNACLCVMSRTSFLVIYSEIGILTSCSGWECQNPTAPGLHLNIDFTKEYISIVVSCDMKPCVIPINRKLNGFVFRLRSPVLSRINKATPFSREVVTSNPIFIDGA